MVSIADMHIRLLTVFYKVLDPALWEKSNNAFSRNNRLDIENIKATVALSQQGDYMPF